MVIDEAIVIRWLVKKFSEKQLIFGASVFLGISFLAWALTPSVPYLLIALVPLALASGTLRVSLSSVITRAVYPEEIGGALGLSAGLGSFARIISPTLGGLLVGRISPSAPGIFGMLIMIWISFFAYHRVLFTSDELCPVSKNEKA